MKRIYNVINFVFCHKYIIRAENKDRDATQLKAMSGNNSFVTGSYRHALLILNLGES
jgi:hypothetical protein